MRHYNSARRIKDRDQTHFSEIGFFDQLGNSAYAYLAVEQQESTFWANRGVDSIGANWTHTYLRSLNIVTSSNATATTTATEALTTAFAYRPDGRVLSFNLHNSQWVGDADVADRVVSIANGYEYFVAETGEVETYNTDGRLLSIRNRSGITHTLAYDSAGRLLSVMDPWGHSLTFTYDAAPGVSGAKNRIWKVTDSAGGTYEYAYDANNNLVSVTAPGGQVRQYLYEAAAAGFPRALTGIIDENNSRYATWGYDSQGRANLSEHADGVDRTTLTYGSLSATATDPNGVVRTYAFSNRFGVASLDNVTQPATGGSGTVTRTLTRDANSNVKARTDFNGNRTCYAYDFLRNLETVRVEGFSPNAGCPANLASYTPAANSRQRKISTQWHATHRLPTQIDELGKRTTYTHDANGNVLTKTILDTSTSKSRTWTYTYNSYGQVLTANGPHTDVADVTTYTYYSCTTGYQCGQVHTITNALGHVTTYSSYNAHGQPLTITDPNGVVTTLSYDLRQRLTSRTVGSEVTAFSYWPTGLLKQATLPDGSFLEYSYDAAHRLTGISDAEGHRIEYTLDAMGNRTAEQVYDPSHALTQTRTRVYNTLNQLWKELGAAGTVNVTTTFSYDNNGNQTGMNAPLGRNTTQSYDELNRLTQVTDPLLGVTQYGYNALGQLIAVTDPRGKITSYSYNALGDLTQQVSPDTGTTVNTYDSGGNLATSTDARSKTGTYAYDILNRVTSLTYPDQTISYTYDSGTNQKGRLTQVTDASGSTSWSYDTHGRVLTRQQSMGAVTKSVGYAYDPYGRLQTLTLPSGHTLSYGYTNGQVTSLTLNGTTAILSNVLYQPFGPTSGWSWGNTTLHVREYGSDGQVTDLDSAGLKTYGYDDALRITSITDGTDPSLSQSYGYDLLDRLTSASGTSLNQGWTYDPNGNRLSQSGSHASSYTIASTNNRISSISGSLNRSYSYDAAGNMTSDGSTTFTYNDAGRLISTTKAGITTTYALNALGQRVKKTANGATTYFVYDEAGHLIGEYDGAGNLIQETVWLGDIPVAVLKPNGSGGVNHFYIHTDHLNTPQKISRSSDNVIVWRWDSDPFGTSAANEDPDGDSNLFGFNLRFPGQYFDTETGLHYNYFRDYDPQIGRYVQSDPIGLRGGINTYSYALENPVTYTDPDGLVPGPRPGYFRRVRCFGEWREKCRQQCANRGGISSCYVTKGALGMPPKIYVIPTSLSCVCNNDDFCKKDPAACIVGGVVATLGICLAPEVTIPAIILGGAATR